jgi:hypothetical protein
MLLKGAKKILFILIFQSLLVAEVLIPMDETQSDHLKAYGVAYHALELGVNVEWLLNYRGGSFLMPEDPEVIKYAQLKGVSFEIVSPTEVAQIYSIIEENNMHHVLLEKAPRVAVYIPPYAEPWDDAVALALEYADIPYDRIYDEDILRGKLDNYDWLHLHHEDFTGQYGKFYLSYHNADWYKEQVRVNETIAKKLGFSKVWQLKHAVAREIQRYVAKGGFLFAMCSAPATLDIALASGDVDIVGGVYDGDPPDENAQEKLDFSKTLAFTNFQLVMDPLIYEHSNIDVTREAAIRGPNTYFSLFEFSAKYDPVPTILTQNHTRVIKEFLGQDTGFRRSLLRKGVVILGEVKGTEEAKYIYGNFGKGFFSFLGGHDPEDYQHFVGDPPTDLRLHKHSPGYRLILNNVLFPAAQKQKLKT